MLNGQQNLAALNLYQHKQKAYYARTRTCYTHTHTCYTHTCSNCTIRKLQASKDDTIIKTVTKNKMLNIMVSNDEGSKQIITQLAKYIQRFFDYANDRKKQQQTHKKRGQTLAFLDQHPQPGVKSILRARVTSGTSAIAFHRHTTPGVPAARAPSGGRHGDGEAVGEVRAIGRRDNSLTFPRRRPLAWRQKLQFGESG